MAAKMFEEALKEGDIEAVREAALAINYIIPNELRSSLWSLVLLGPNADEELKDAERLLNEVDDDEYVENFVDHRVIAQDVNRTRGEITFFKREDTQAWMRRALTAFCCGDPKNISKHPPTEYMQGLNEILAPFCLIEANFEINEESKNNSTDDKLKLDVPKLPGVLHFCLFRRFVHSMMPTMFCEESAVSLRCHLRLFSDILAYHEPGLSQLLDKCQMTPEVFATPWFVTLMARHTPMLTLFCLWDHLLLMSSHDFLSSLASRPEGINSDRVGDPCLFPFICLAFLRVNRTLIGATHGDYLPQTLTQLTLNNSFEVFEVITIAKQLRDHTPLSFLELIVLVCYSNVGHSTEKRTKLLHQLEATRCVVIHTHDLLTTPVTQEGFSTHVPPSPSSASNITKSLLPPKSPRRPPTATATATSAKPPTFRYLLIDCGHSNNGFPLDLSPCELETPQARPEYKGTFGAIAAVVSRLLKLTDDVHVVLVGGGCPETRARRSSNASNDGYESSESLRSSTSKRRHSNASNDGYDSDANGEEDDTAIAFAHLFTGRGVHRVSILQGGVESLKAVDSEANIDWSSWFKVHSDKVMLHIPENVLSGTTGEGVDVKSKSKNKPPVLTAEEGGEPVKRHTSEEVIALRRLRIRVDDTLESMLRSRQTTMNRILAPMLESSSNVESALNGSSMDGTEKADSNNVNTKKDKGTDVGVKKFEVKRRKSQTAVGPKDGRALAESVSLHSMNLHASLETLSTDISLSVNRSTSSSHINVRSKTRRNFFHLLSDGSLSRRKQMNEDISCLLREQSLGGGDDEVEEFTV